MELSAGSERRARYLAPGSDQCEGLLIPASCCKQSDAACDFSVESECDAAVSEGDDSSGSVIIPAAIQLSSVGDDLGTVLAAQTTIPGMAAANAAMKDVWNIIETAAQDPVQQAELQACREKPVLLVTGVAKLQAWERRRQRAQQLGQRVPPPARLRIVAVYTPQLPAEEVEAANGAEAMAYGATSAHASEAARLLRTQLVMQRPAEVQLRMLLEYDSRKPPAVAIKRFLNRLCGVTHPWSRGPPLLDNMVPALANMRGVISALEHARLAVLAAQQEATAAGTAAPAAAAVEKTYLEALGDGMAPVLSNGRGDVRLVRVYLADIGLCELAAAVFKSDAATQFFTQAGDQGDLRAKLQAVFEMHAPQAVKASIVALAAQVTVRAALHLAGNVSMQRLKDLAVQTALVEGAVGVLAADGSEAAIDAIFQQHLPQRVLAVRTANRPGLEHNLYSISHQLLRLVGAVPGFGDAALVGMGLAASLPALLLVGRSKEQQRQFGLAQWADSGAFGRKADPLVGYRKCGALNALMHRALSAQHILMYTAWGVTYLKAVNQAAGDALEQDPRLIAERSKAATTLRDVSTPDAQGFHVKLPLPLPVSGDAGEWPPDQALSKQLDWGLPGKDAPPRAGRAAAAAAPSPAATSVPAASAGAAPGAASPAPATAAAAPAPSAIAASPSAAAAAATVAPASQQSHAAQPPQVAAPAAGAGVALPGGTFADENAPPAGVSGTAAQPGSRRPASGIAHSRPTTLQPGRSSGAAAQTNAQARPAREAGGAPGTLPARRFVPPMRHAGSGEVGNLKEENAQLRAQLAEKEEQLAEKEEEVRREKRAREAAEEEVRREKRLRDSLERSVTALQARLKSAGQTAPLGVRQQQQQAQASGAAASSSSIGRSPTI